MTTFKIDHLHGGINPDQEPIHVKVTTEISDMKGVRITGRTCGDNGCTTSVTVEGVGVISHNTFFTGFGNTNLPDEMAFEVAKDLNIILALVESKARIVFSDLVPVMVEVFKKCKSRKGKFIPDEKYEALVTFNE